MVYAYNLTLINFYPLVVCVCVLDLNAMLFTQLLAGSPTTDTMLAEQTFYLSIKHLLSFWKYIINKKYLNNLYFIGSLNVALWKDEVNF